MLRRPIEPADRLSRIATIRPFEASGLELGHLAVPDFARLGVLHSASRGARLCPLIHIRRRGSRGASLAAAVHGNCREEAMLRLLVLLGCASLAAACVNGPNAAPTPASSRSHGQTQTNPLRPSGLVYAEKTCSACHAVAAGQTRSPDPRAPTFETIANTPGMTIMALNVWLHSSQHRDMPYLNVGEDHLEMLSEYLYSLRN